MQKVDFKSSVTNTVTIVHRYVKLVIVLLTSCYHLWSSNIFEGMWQLYAVNIYWAARFTLSATLGYQYQTILCKFLMGARWTRWVYCKYPHLSQTDSAECTILALLLELVFLSCIVQCSTQKLLIYVVAVLNFCFTCVVTSGSTPPTDCNVSPVSTQANLIPRLWGGA